MEKSAINEGHGVDYIIIVLCVSLLVRSGLPGRREALKEKHVAMLRLSKEMATYSP